MRIVGKLMAVSLCVAVAISVAGCGHKKVHAKAFSVVADPSVKGAVTGLFYGGGAGQVTAQLIACVVVAAWAFGAFYIFFTIQKKTTGLRSSEADELAGLDSTEMGVLAYPDFSGATAQGGSSLAEAPTGTGM